jgi:hypothetical protein
MTNADLQHRGFAMASVQGAASGTDYRGIAKNLGQPSPDVSLTTVSYVGRDRARFTQVTTTGIDVPDQTLYDINAQLVKLQVERFHALPSPPEPTAAPTAATTTPLKPLDAQTLVLAPADLGANWSLTTTTGDTHQFETAYFNESVEYSGFGVDRLIVLPLQSATAADARIGLWKASFASQNMQVHAWSGLGDGTAARIYNTTAAGLKTVAFIYRVGPVMILSSAEAASISVDQSLEAEALRLGWCRLRPLATTLAAHHGRRHARCGGHRRAARLRR